MQRIESGCPHLGNMLQICILTFSGDENPAPFGSGPVVEEASSSEDFDGVVRGSRG